MVILRCRILAIIYNETENHRNYQSITCLSTSYKLLTSILTERTYCHLEEHNICLIKQKGCRGGSYGCKDQLLMMILENTHRKHKNLSVVWIDYKKAFNSTLHLLITKALEIYKIWSITENFFRPVILLDKSRILMLSC